MFKQFIKKYNPPMVIVIIAGGSGTRLWPLSKADYPKHLLKLTGPKSLLQNTYARAKGVADDIYIVTEISHAAEVKKQLPKLGANNIIIEPARRGTASCIMLALARLKEYVRNDEPVIFLHADHHISNTPGFVRSVQAAGDAAAKYRMITLIGLHPDYPATGFGYIKHGAEVAKINDLSVYKVEQFVEKPELELADQYLKAGSYLIANSFSILVRMIYCAHA